MKRYCRDSGDEESSECSDAEPLEGDESLVAEGGTTNIRKDLEAILTSRAVDWNFAFSFRQTYPDAPNPVLSLADLGTVGLPLSTREADAVKSRAVQAPFGMGERTLVDKTVRDTWEMDSAKVSFDGPRWGEFVDRAVEDICKALNVNCKTSKPDCKLHKLLLYETGSHFLPHVDTEKADGMFATMIIILPSQFLGGNVRVTHGGLSLDYDCSATSVDQTTVLAWYTDVTHEVKPITSGYRLALSYNLIHTNKVPSPATAPTNAVSARVAKVLQAWQNTDPGSHAPEKIICLLDHKYSHANFHSGALKGSDAQKAAVLANLAPSHGFVLGLANVSCRLAGTADDSSGRRYGNVGFDEVQDSDLTVEHLVDMSGKLLAPVLYFEEEQETIPEELTDAIGDGPCDQEDYESYTGNEAGSLERWYRRSVLVIWPERHHLSVIYNGKEGFNRVLTTISASTSKKSSPEERALIDALLQHTEGDRAEATRLACKTACRWRDVDLWAKAVETSMQELGVDAISDELKFEAAKVFGFKKIQKSFEIMLSADKRNAQRLDFLAAVEQWMRTRPPANRKKVTKEVQPWLKAQTQSVLESVKHPKQSECAAFLGVALRNGGIGFIKEHMVPRLLKTADGPFLAAFSRCIHGESSFERSSAREITEELLANVVHTKPLYPLLEPNPSAGSRRPVHNPKINYCARAYQYAATCVELEHDDLARAIFSKILNIAIEAQDKPDVLSFARSFMLPFVLCMLKIEGFDLQHAVTSEFKDLRATTVKLCMDFLTTTAHDTKGILTQVMDVAVLKDGNPDVTICAVLPALEPTKWFLSRIPALVDELCEAQKRTIFPEGYKGQTIAQARYRLADRYVREVSLSSSDSIAKELAWAGNLHLRLAQRVLARAFDDSTWTAQHITDVLLPLVPKVRTWATTGERLDSLARPFQTLAAGWAGKVCTPPPVISSAILAEIEGMRRWTCTCTYCADTRRFLEYGPEQSKGFRQMNQEHKTHILQELAKYAPHVAIVERGPMYPWSLIIYKVDGLRPYAAWRVKQDSGKRMLRDMSKDDKELRRLLGEQYERVTTILASKPVESAAAAVPEQMQIAAGLRRPADALGMYAKRPAGKRRKR